MYRAPLEELRFVLEELLGSGQLAARPALADYSDEVGRSILRRPLASQKPCSSR